MKFKVDENLPRAVCALLRAAGHDACDVVEQNLRGATDPEVFGVCQEEERVLVTLDVGFANIEVYPPGATPGIIVLRPSRQDKTYIVDLVQSLLPLLDEEPIARKLWIVEDLRVRIRG